VHCWLLNTKEQALCRGWRAEEHAARVQAEAEAQDSSRRLAVAQEQLAEYAQQSAADSVELLREAESAEALLSRCAAAGCVRSPARQIDTNATDHCTKNRTRMAG
jgi:hypothetical protein